MRPLHDDLLCAHPAFCKYCCCCCSRTHYAAGQTSSTRCSRPTHDPFVSNSEERRKKSSSRPRQHALHLCLPASLNHGSVDPVMTLDRCLWSTPPGSVNKLHCEISRNGPAGLRRNAWPLLAAPLLVNHGLSQIYSTTSCHAAPAPALAPAPSNPPRHTISTAANLCLHGHGSQLTAVDPLLH